MSKPTAKSMMSVDVRDLRNPVKHASVMRRVRAFNIAGAEYAAELYDALQAGRATLGDSDDDGCREIVFQGEPTGVKIDKEAARRFGVTDWTEERELREDTVL